MLHYASPRRRVHSTVSIQLAWDATFLLVSNSYSSRPCYRPSRIEHLKHKLCLLSDRKQQIIILEHTALLIHSLKCFLANKSVPNVGKLTLSVLRAIDPVSLSLPYVGIRTAAHSGVRVAIV
jgi:hypothetical protein